MAKNKPKERPLVNATAASLLGFLHRGAMTGWDLVETAQQRIGGFWSLTSSQVYRELAAMAKAGLIEAGLRGPRDRQPYAITSSGREAFEAWIEREPGPEIIRFPLLLAVSFGRYIPKGKLASIVARHRAMHTARLEHYVKELADFEGMPDADPYSVATLQFGLQYERAAIAWFDGLPAIIRGRDKLSSAHKTKK